MKQKTLLTTFLSMLLFICHAYAQNIPVKGKITDTGGSPIPGVSVKVKGTSNGTSTSGAGTFSLSVPPNATLVISAVGYATKEQAVGNRQNIEISLAEDNQSLQEVVINGAYGTVNKSTYTGSATVVSAAKIQSTQPTNVSQALQGMSPGVQVSNTNGAPGSDGTVTVRGLSSVGGDNSPLYVLDGMPYNGNLSALNPNDIESMTVLKDAAATSLYGSRAANGVIVITSKKGTSATPVINARTNFGFSDMAVAFPDKTSPQQTLELAWEAVRNGRIDQFGESAAVAAQYATNNVVSYYFQKPAQNVFNTATPIGLDGKLKPDAVQLFDGDWYGEFFSQRLRQEHTLDISGSAGTDNRTQYYISGAYLNDLGSFKVQKFERYSGRVNVNSQVKKWLSVGTNVSYTHSFQQNPGVEARFTRTIPSLYPVYTWDYANNTYVRDPNGNLLPDFGDASRTEWRGWNPGFVGDYKNDDDWAFSGRYIDNLSTRSFSEITFMPGLKLRSGISTDIQNFNNLSYSSATLTSSAGNRGSANRISNRNFALTLNNLLTYDHSWGEHHINILAGQEAYKLQITQLTAGRQGFPSTGLWEIGAAGGQISNPNSYEDNYRLESYLSRVDYDFNKRYYLSASFRKDGSSRFDPDHRWGNFWSVGASWLLTEEDFLKGNSWINNLKLRASHGTVGNDKVAAGYYAYQGLYRAGWNDSGKSGVILSALPNPNLVWESNVQTDAGLDFTLFKRLSGSLDYFSRTSKDLIFRRPLAPSVGIASIYENVGDVKNSGLELDLNVKIFTGTGFNWSVDANASHYKNVITRLPQSEIIESRFKLTEGVSRYEFFGPVWAGVNPLTGNNTWYKFNDDGSKTATEDWTSVNTTANSRYLGSSIPDLFGAITNNFSYKGFDLSVMFYYSLGGKMYDGDYAEGVRWRRGFSMSTQILDRWTPDNTETSIPRLSEFTQNNVTVFSSQYLFNNSFLRLRNLSFGYTLPTTFTQRIGVNAVKIYAQGTNLLTWGNAAKRGTDPETTMNGIVANGPDGQAIGSVRKSWSFGLQATF